MTTTTTPPGRVSHVATALAKDRLGVPMIVGHALSGSAPLTVVAAGTTTGFAITGTNGLPVAYIVAALTLAVFSVGFVAMSRHIVNAGSFYTYIAQGISKPFGVAAAFMANLSYTAMQNGLYGGFAALLGAFAADRFGIDAAWYVWAFIACAIVALCGVLRIDLNGAILGFLLACELLVIGVYDLVLAVNPGPEGYSTAGLSLSHLSTAAFGAAAVTAIAGFVGFEGTTVFAEEAKDPKKTIKRATYLSLAVIGVLYGASAWLMTVAAGPSNIVTVAGEHQTELLFHLVSPHVGQFFIDAGHVLVITSLFAALQAFHNTVARYFFAQGREGVLPRVLGRTGRRTGAPVAGSLLQSLTGFATISVFAVMNFDPVVHLFFWCTVYGGLGVLLLMTLTSVAVFLYFARARLSRDPGAPKANFWAVGVAPVIAVFALAWMATLTITSYHNLLGVPEGHIAATLFPAGMAAVFGIGLLWGLWLKVAAPRVYAAIGLGASTVTVHDAGGPGVG